MKEDILKFRKLCGILVKQEGMSLNKVSIESGITWPTLKKVMEEGIDSIHIRSSVLGQVQDYLHKKADVLNYEGISSDVNITQKSDEDLSAEVRKKESEVALAEKRKEEFVKENEKVSLSGKDIHERHEELLKEPLSLEETRKYIRNDKGNVSSVEGLTSGKKGRGLALDNPARTGKQDGDETIGPRNLVQIILFLRMKATEHRQIAHDFEVSAAQLEKANL